LLSHSHHLDRHSFSEGGSPVTRHASRITHHPSRITGFPLPIAQMFFCICSYFKNNSLTFTMNQCKCAIGRNDGLFKNKLDILAGYDYFVFI